MKQERLTLEGYHPVFASLIASYPEEVLHKNGISTEQLNINNFYPMLTGGSPNVADNSVDANANVSHKTTASVMQEIDKPRQKLFALYNIWLALKEEQGETRATNVIHAIISGLLYPHDLAMFVYTFYCYSFSALDIMKKGLPFIEKLPSDPANHASSFIAHVNQFIQFASNHQSGATALPGLFVAYAYYAKKDKLTLKQRQQDYQEFIHTDNQPVRYSAQSPFINVSLLDREYLKGLYGTPDDKVLEDGTVIKGKPKFVYPDGSLPDWDLVDQIQREFYEFFNDTIDRTGIPITFPVLTTAIMKDENNDIVDKEFFSWFCKENVRHAASNILVSNSPDSFASCCRMLNYIDPLKYTNSFGAGGDHIGSWGVCTLNLAGIAGEVKKSFPPDTDSKVLFQQFLEEVEYYAEMSREIVRLRRKFVQKNIDMGLLPHVDHGFVKPESLYLTVGITGAFESLSILGLARNQDEYIYHCTDLLGLINDGNEKATDHSTYSVYNFEQVPAENAAVKLAELDNLYNRHSYSMLSNQWLPLSYDTDIFDRLETAGCLDTAMSGGAIVHISSGSAIDVPTMEMLIKYAVKTNNVYFAVNLTFSSCEDCKEITHSEVDICPVCGSHKITQFTRVVGFITPKKAWNKVRREEKRKQLDLSVMNSVDLSRVSSAAD